MTDETTKANNFELQRLTLARKGKRERLLRAAHRAANLDAMQLKSNPVNPVQSSEVSRG